MRPLDRSKMFFRSFRRLFYIEERGIGAPSNDVRLGNSIDTTRVPAQKVHNYRADRWIALKHFSRVLRGCFIWSSVQSVLHVDDVWSSPCNYTTRVLGQKVHDYRSYRWSVLKFFLGARGGCFTWSSLKSVLHSDDVWSGHSTDMTKVPT